jgi:hypothetical protein
MSILSLVDTEYLDFATLTPQRGPAQDLYVKLLSQPQEHLEDARAFLDAHLRHAISLPCELPDTPQQLMQWMRAGASRVTSQYNAYLQGRKEGEPRRYFSGRAHALYFLRAVAPTKLVDGAWLYSTLRHWREVRLHTLVQTYLEELGDGVPQMNHVLMYQQLLSSNGCEELASLDDENYLQGALQLALGTLGEHYLPEVIGYNLGYEQLPLHLLISAYELDELGIDPYYFKLHVTIDNAVAGHARKAVQTVLDNLPQIGDADEFYQRVRDGYQLNELGLGSTAAVQRFDLEHELVTMLESKRSLAGHVHSDYCRIEGRTVNEWLSGPEPIRGFLAALQNRGWIVRHQAPDNSRFWHLVQGEGAAMFGVFTPYELQVLHDWIAGDWLLDHKATYIAAGVPSHTDATRRMRAAHRRVDPAGLGELAPSSDIDCEQYALAEELAALTTEERERRLLDLAGPATHCTPAGLMATRILSTLVR